MQHQTNRVIMATENDVAIDSLHALHVEPARVHNCIEG